MRLIKDPKRWQGDTYKTIDNRFTIEDLSSRHRPPNENRYAKNVGRYRITDCFDNKEWHRSTLKEAKEQIAFTIQITALFVEGAKQ